MRLLFILLLLPVVLAGCGQLGPIPTKPEAIISVSIDSIPSGADVYAIEADGQLGGKIGTTPFVHVAGIAGRYWIRNNTGERITRHNMHGFGHGTRWESITNSQGQKCSGLFLGIALAKGGHSLGVAKKELCTDLEPIQSKAMSITVPLMTIEQVNLEKHIQAQQRALQMQQNINIQHQKDELDTMNSAFDVLLKLNGLRALQ